ncbi:MAG: polysaccharide deacetylase family protein [Pirellulaceae bacterium]
MTNSVLRNAIGYLSYFSGATAITRAAKPREGAIILMGHRVRNDEDAFLGGISLGQFERLVRYLRQHYHPLSLSVLLEHIQNNVVVPDNSVVLTFDDGFRDNYENAFPILQKYGMPATVFLVTGSINSGQLPWPQQVGYALQHTRKSSIAVRIDDTGKRRFHVHTRQQRRSVFREILALRRILSLDELEQLRNSIIRACDVDLPVDRMLTWNQVRQMQQHHIEFGAHTVSHPLMAYVTMEEARRQMVESKRTIEEQLQVPVRSFCFPSGSCNDRLVALVVEVGLKRLSPSSCNVDMHCTNAALTWCRWGVVNVPPQPTNYRNT